MNSTIFHKSPLLFLAAVLAVGGCDCDSDSPTVEILSPAPGQMLTLADDENTASPGLQYCVRTRTTGLDATELQLYLDASRLASDPMALPDARLDVTEDGEVCFDTDFAPGSYQLLVCADDCTVRSNEVAITVEDPCGAISFVTPSGTGDVRLGPSDNASGPGMCETFTTPVRAATRAADGTSAQLFVNDAPASTATVSGGVIDFGNVVLGNRGDDANTLRIELDAGTMCEAVGPRLFVDCGGVSCAITRPDTGSAFLNQDDDTSMEDGFQTTFELTMSADAADTATLRINGEEFTAPTMIVGDDRVATFANIGLEDGPQVVDGVCTSRSGADTRTTATWTVDTVACEVDITTPLEGAEIIDADDVNTDEDGIQTNVTGTFAGEGCTAVRVGVCDAMLATVDADASSFAAETTLSGSATQELCAEVEDIAGNVAESRISIRVTTDAPQLDIVTPTTGTRFNSAGVGATGDLNTDTETCEAMILVNCSTGGEVSINRMGVDTSIATADCEETDGLEAPYTHQASFVAPLPSQNDGTGYNLVAQLTEGRLTGISGPVEVVSDCDVPTLEVLAPECGTILRPAVDDTDPVTAGLQTDVRVINSLSSGADDVTLSVTGLADRTEGRFMASSINVFDDVTFGLGSVTVRACATDSLGNVGCSDDTAGACTFTIEDLPTIDIVAPVADSILSSADDCDAAAGMQVRVRVTTDAEDGATASIQFAAEDASSAVVAGGEVDVCVDAPQGVDVPVTVTLTSTRGVVMATTSVTIDSIAPATEIDTLAFDTDNSDRRGGSARFNFVSVSDSGGAGLTSYEMRCADAAITDQTAWDAASVFDVEDEPADAGAMESIDVLGFQPGVVYQCTIRGADATGALSPIGNSVEVTLPFLTQEITLASAAQLGWSVVAVGSVDGDAFPDFITAGAGEVYLHFGGDTPSAAPGVRIVGPDRFGHSSTFELGGNQIAGIGDFNADGRPDFAVGSPNDDTFTGSVFVFFGRATRADWQPVADTLATIDTSASCAADVCFRGADTITGFGGSIEAVGDFDGDGVVDMAIGAPFTDGGSGANRVIRGGDSYQGLDAGERDMVIDDALHGGFIWTSAVTGLGLGKMTASMGDTTGDGRNEIVMSMSGRSSASVSGRVLLAEGRAYVGPTGLDATDQADERVVLMGSGGGFLGHTIVNLGDVDGMGRADIGVFDLLSGGRGIVRLLAGEGATSFSAATEITNMVVDNSSDRFGQYLGGSEHAVFGSIGDIDGDGFTDILTGSAQRGMVAGSAELFYGGSLASRTRTDASVSFSPEPTPGAPGSTRVNRSVGFVGDINNDGHSDFVVGDPLHAPAGRAVLYY